MRSPTDNFIHHFDNFLRATAGSVGKRNRSSPGGALASVELSQEERDYSARLMRINHTGEVCAQALYHGQSLTSQNRQTSDAMLKAADEETDHLSWCEERITQLDSHVSYLNPLWYLASFSMGAITGLLGDKVNLGFVAATEEEVCQHLDDHLEKISPNDTPSRAILTQMREDENKHADMAFEQGGAKFPAPIKRVMRGISRLMTRSSYWV